MKVVAIKKHYANGKRRKKDEVFEVDKNLFDSLFFCKCVKIYIPNDSLIGLKPS